MRVDEAKETNGAHNITLAYLETTAGRSHQRNISYYRYVASDLHRKLRPWLPKDKTSRIVDLGCGCGELLFLLQSLGYSDLSGVDLCQPELDEAAHFSSAKLLCADIVVFLRAQAEGSIGALFALNLLEHLPKPLLINVLVEVRRVLVPGGTLVAVVPNAISPFGGSTRYWDLTHELAFTPNNFHQLAALTGFSSTVDFMECRPRPHGIFSTIRALLWQVLRALIAGWFLIEVAGTRGGIYSMDMAVRLRARTPVIPTGSSNKSDS
jgi:SAM-dependent methyltransferase